MAYLLLTAGLVCIIFGIIGSKREEAIVPIDVKINSGKDSFDGYLSERMLIERLDSIDEKLDYLCSIPPIDQYENEENDEIIDETELESVDISSEIETSDITEPNEINDADNTDDINDIALSMKNKGVPLEEIAAKLGKTKGEVLLRLGMKK